MVAARPSAINLALQFLKDATVLRILKSNESWKSYPKKNIVACFLPEFSYIYMLKTTNTAIMEKHYG